MNQFGGRSLRLKCECEVCRELGDKTTHNDASHDQALDQTISFLGRALHFSGGTTKCARVMIRFLASMQQDIETVPASSSSAGAASTVPMGNTRDDLRQKKILEVGSGTGIVGICMSLLGANHVCLTDQDAVLELLQYNVDANLSFDEAKKTSVRLLQWGEPPRDAHESFDLVVGSDLIFAKENIPVLIKTFEHFARLNRQTVFYLACIRRFKWEDSFFEGMKASFMQERVHHFEDIEIFRFKPIQ